MKKLILAIILLFVISTANAQTVSYASYNNMWGIGFTQTLDSTVTSYTSSYYNVSNFNFEKSIFCSYSLVQSHWGYTAGNDTIWIILKGKDWLGNTRNADTISAACVSYLTQAAASQYVTLTLTSYFPMWAVYIAPKVSGGNTANGKSAVLNITFTGYKP